MNEPDRPDPPDRAAVPSRPDVPGRSDARDAQLRPPKVPRPVPVPRVSSPLIERLRSDPDRLSLDRFWEDTARTCPLIEWVGWRGVPGRSDASGEVAREAESGQTGRPGRAKRSGQSEELGQSEQPEQPGQMIVTFVWRDLDGDAEEVLLFANRLTDETSLADTLLEQLPGTDLWHASFRMGADWRASYSFLVRRRGGRAPWLVADQTQVALRAALDRGRPDPRNPLTCRNRAGVLQSVVQGPLAPDQPWLAERPGVVRGTLAQIQGPAGRAVWLYDPPGAGPQDPLPLLVVLDGEVWVGHQSLPTTLDNLHTDGLGTARAVFLDSGGREARWSDLSADGSGTAYVADVLIRWVRSVCGVRSGPEAVTVVGQSLGGLTALRLGLTRPDAVGTVVSHSASLWQDGLLGPDPPAGLRVFLSHGSQEWVLDGPHRALAGHLGRAGVELEVSIRNGGHDYAWWRGGVADGIIWALGRSARDA